MESLKRKSGYLIAICFCLVPFQIQATPDASVWQGMNLLGANDQHYYVITSERTLPGSYYSYRERMTLEKYHTRLNRKVSETILSDIQYTMDDPESGKWHAKSLTSTTFDLAGYIAREKIVPVYRESLNPDLQIDYKPDGLYMVRKGKSLLLRPLGKSRLVPEDELTVTGVFYVPGHVLLEVSQGEQMIDQDYTQKLLPISLSVFQKARRMLTRRKQ